MSKFSMKKILPMVAGLGVVAASASSVVACTSPIYAAGVDGQRVLVVTDGGHINDLSFNQDAYIGVKNFVKDAYVETEADSKGNLVNKKDADGNLIRLDGTNDYVEAGGTDTTSIVSAYGLAVTKGANMIVTPGFSHVNTLGMALPFLHKHNVKVVLVDGFLEDPNIISIQFNSQISGVMAGFDTSYLFGSTYVDKNGKPTTDYSKAVKDGDKPKFYYDTNNDGKLKLGTFAGASNKYGVDNYMWGLLVGMEIYNELAANNNQLGTVESANNVAGKGNTGKVSDVAVSSDQDPNWYTNSFALGDATKSGILASLIDENKADVIFPVAGPQIQDVLSFIPKDKSAKAPYVIGVDVDQAAEFSDDKGRFITSAIKNIDTAVPEALYRASTKGKDDNTLKDFGTVMNDGKKYGSFKDAKAKNEEWMGTKVDPFVNWSIDFTTNNYPVENENDKRDPERYQLKRNFIKFYDENNVMTAPGKDSAMRRINDFFFNLGGANPHANAYMIGEQIVSIAQEIIKNYVPADDQKKIGADGWTLDLSSSPISPAPSKAGDSNE